MGCVASAILAVSLIPTTRFKSGFLPCTFSNHGKLSIGIDQTLSILLGVTLSPISYPIRFTHLLNKIWFLTPYPFQFNFLFSTHSQIPAHIHLINHVSPQDCLLAPLKSSLTHHVPFVFLLESLFTPYTRYFLPSDRTSASWSPIYEV